MLPSFPSTRGGDLGSVVSEEHWETLDDPFMKTLMTFWNNSPVQFSPKILYPGYNLLIMNKEIDVSTNILFLRRPSTLTFSLVRKLNMYLDLNINFILYTFIYTIIKHE